MPYPKIRVEYTNADDILDHTFDVDESHVFHIGNAKHPEHETVEVVCSGDEINSPGTQIVFKLNP